jgi:hypothetical protein
MRKITSTSLTKRYFESAKYIKLDSIVMLSFRISLFILLLFLIALLSSFVCAQSRTDEAVSLKPKFQHVDSIFIKNKNVWIHDEYGERQITFDNDIDIAFGLSGDKKLLLVKTLIDGEYPSGDLYLYNIVSGERSLISEGTKVQSATWSPQYNSVAVVTYLPKYNALYIIDLSSGSLKELVGENVSAFSTQYSPDGNFIAFTYVTQEYPQITDIAIVNVNTGIVNKVTNDGHSYNPMWDGNEGIVFLRDRELYYKDLMRNTEYKIKTDHPIDAILNLKRSITGDTLFIRTRFNYQIQDNLYIKSNKLFKLLNYFNISSQPNLKLPFPAGESWILTCGYGCGGHTGNEYYAVDFALPGCDSWLKPILSASSGTVIASTFGNYGEGRYIKIDHGGGYTTGYYHLACWAISVGSTVPQGGIIGLCGNTGNVSGQSCPTHPGTHIHFVLKQNNISVPPTPISGYQTLEQGKPYLSNNSPIYNNCSSSGVINIVCSEFSRKSGPYWWVDVGGLSGGSNQGIFLYTYSNGSTEDYWAQWRPNLSQTGLYRVEAYIPNSTNVTSSSAKYIVYYSGGSQTVTVNQSANRGRWVDLGTYNFSSGNSGYVKLTDASGEPYMQTKIAFDAIRFTFLGSAPTPPPAPVLSSPANGSINQPTTLTLSWNASPGATSYRLQVADNSSFTLPKVDQGGITGTSWQVKGLDYNKTYYWRVNASNSSGTSPWSSVWSFTTAPAPTVLSIRSIDPKEIIVNSAPYQATLTLIGSGFTGVTQIVFTWSGAVSGTSTWNKGDANWVNKVEIRSDTLMVLKPVVVESNPTWSGTVNWVVTLKNNTGESASASFKVIYQPTPPPAPVLSSPANGSINQPTTLTLSWNASPGATSYRLQVADNSSFTLPKVDQGGITGTSWQVKGLDYNKTYYWRVNASNSSGTSPWSSVWSFTTAPAPTVLSIRSIDPKEIIVNSAPYQATLTLIGSGFTGVTQIVFTWSGAVSGTSTWNKGDANWVNKVEIRSDTLMVLKPVVVESNPTWSGTVNWVVTLKNNTGESASASFKVIYQPTPPPAPVLSSPANGSINQPTTLTLSWNASPGATSYRLQVADNSSFTLPKVDQGGITGTSWQVKGLDYNKTYYWRVNASNSSGTSPWSSVWSFTTAPAPTVLSIRSIDPKEIIVNSAPYQATLTLIGSGFTGVTQIVFTWSGAVSGTSTWNKGDANWVNKVEIRSDTLMVLKPVVVESNPTWSGTVNWVVTLKNNTGESASASFKVIYQPTPPPAPVLSSPANGSINQPTTLTLSWNASPGATSYRLQVADNSSFTLPKVDQGGITGTSWQVKGLDYNKTYYWRVNASNSSGTSPWSSVWSFTTAPAPTVLSIRSIDPKEIIVNSAPYQATLTLIGSGFTGVTQIVFTWSGAVSGTSTWNKGDANWVNKVEIRSDTLMVLKPVVVESNPTWSGTVNWVVTLKNNTGESASASFKVIYQPTPPPAPVLSSPANGSINQPTTLTLSWNASPGATSYRLQVADNSSFTLPKVDQGGITGTSWQVKGLDYNKTYYWRVNASNSSGTSPWSSVWSFTTAPAPTVLSIRSIDPKEIIVNSAPYQATLTLIGSGFTGVTQIVFTWSGAVSGTSTWNKGDANWVNKVEIRSDTLMVLKPVVVESNPTWSGTVNWVVTLKNNTGESASASFKVIYQPTPPAPTLPSPPVLVSPGTNSPPGQIINTTRPTFQWQSVSGADQYGLYIEKKNNSGGWDLIFDSPSLGITITGTSYTLQDGILTDGGEYRWYMNSHNSSGWGNYSNTLYFKVVLPASISVDLAYIDFGDVQVGSFLDKNITIRNSGSGTLSVRLSISGNSFSIISGGDTFNLSSGQTRVVGIRFSPASGGSYTGTLNITHNATNQPSPITIPLSGNGVELVTHGIPLLKGWNMISSFVLPIDIKLDSIFKNIKSNLVILKDGLGRSYWPFLGVDQIGNWSIYSGYQVYMKNPDTLKIVGHIIKPETTIYSLQKGWNLISYVRRTPMDIDSALSSIKSYINIVKDNDGRVYWPKYTVNQIGLMGPGQGYLINVTQECRFSYPANEQVSTSINLNIIGSTDSSYKTSSEPVHFKFVRNTGNNATVGIPLSAQPSVNGVPLEIGDEIGAFTPAGLCVGAVVWEQKNTALTVWGDDEMTQEVDGIKPGEQISYRIWKRSTDREYQATATYSLGDGIYQPNAIFILSSLSARLTPVEISDVNLPNTFVLYQNYPNPFNPTTTIKYGIPVRAHVKLEIYNILGQKVETLIDALQEPGFYFFDIDASRFSGGVYFYRLTAVSEKSVFSDYKKMIILK